MQLLPAIALEKTLVLYNAKKFHFFFKLGMLSDQNTFQCQSLVVMDADMITSICCFTLSIDRY